MPPLFYKLSRLSDLRTLELRSVTISPDVTTQESQAMAAIVPPDTAQDGFPRLENLLLENVALDNQEFTSLTSWVANAQQDKVQYRSSGLRRVSLDLQPSHSPILDLDNLRACGQLLHAAGPTLEHLSLDCNELKLRHGTALASVANIIPGKYI